MIFSSLIKSERRSILITSTASIVVAPLLKFLVNYLCDISVEIISNFYVIPAWPSFISSLISAVTYPIVFNPLSIFLYTGLVTLVCFYLFKFFLSKTNNEVIFIDDFKSDTNTWIKNYWGTSNTGNTIHIEDSQMVFEANHEWENNYYGKNINGACIDLRHGIYHGLTYEVSCLVKATTNATMGFQLWVHDGQDSPSEYSNIDFQTPKNNFEYMKLRFTATNRNCIRIHLHCKAGIGKIFVKQVKVVKVNHN